jgi:Tfp pilus assembly protein PilV
VEAIVAAVNSPRIDPHASAHSKSATTLVETMIAVILVAAFFAAIFEVNGMCLRYIDASKESVAALQGIQDRIELTRSLLFTQLTDATKLQSRMVNPGSGQPCTKPDGTPSGDCSEFIQKVTEVVTLSAYPTPNASSTQITRGPGASTTPTINSTDADLAKAKLVKVNVRYTWNMTLGGRAASEESETIISAGSKK